MTILSSLFLNERVLSISLTARDGGTKPDERWKIRLELKTHFSYSSDQALVSSVINILKCNYFTIDLMLLVHFILRNLRAPSNEL